MRVNERAKLQHERDMQLLEAIMSENNDEVIGSSEAAIDQALKSGAEINAKITMDDGSDNARPDKKTNITPLIAAVRYLPSKSVPYLLKKLIDLGADVNMRDGDGYTALHEAAAIDDHAACILLLEAGANLEAEGASRFTPLHMAAFNSNDITTKLLLAMGANIHAKTADVKQEAGDILPGKTPADLAVDNLTDHAILLQSLEAGNIDRPTLASLRYEYPEIELAVDINKRQASLDAIASAAPAAMVASVEYHKRFDGLSGKDRIRFL